MSFDRRRERFGFCVRDRIYSGFFIFRNKHIEGREKKKKSERETSKIYPSSLTGDLCDCKFFKSKGLNLTTMDNSQSSIEIGEAPSSIVRIAYRQLSIMTGMSDLAEPKVVNGNKLTKEENGYMVCTKRFFRLPIFLSAMSSMCHAYTTIKQSHESVTTVFDSVESGLSKGVEYVSPITNRIGETLERPLKTIDNAVCISLDFLEEKVPPIKLSLHEIYENTSNNIREAISSKVNTCVNLLGNIVGQVHRLKTSADQNTPNDNNNNNNSFVKNK